MKITIETSEKEEVFDITEQIEKVVRAQNKEDGVCNVFVAHTTCAITTADLDPGTDLDTLEFLRKIVPVMEFRHPHDPEHTPDHILSSIIGSSVSIPFENKKLALGTWQRVILIELNGPREREVHITVL